MSEKSDIVGLGASIAGIFAGVTLFVGIFMRESAWVLAPIAFSFALMGIFLGYFASRKR